MKESLKEHWESIYKTKQANEVSWTQDVPAISLDFIHKLNIPKTAKIIDIGGGDSKLVDFLLAEGYSNLSVLDISEAAILRAKERLGNNANNVTWIVSDILDFKPNEKYDLWHDRAAFHFQTETEKIEKYLNIVKNAVDGMVIIGTFSDDGPKKCSGLDIRQYDEEGMKEKFEKSDFKNLECKREDHITPAGAVQNFVFCSFIKKEAHSNLQDV
jgi:SAM-dependent methyltransferase